MKRAEVSHEFHKGKYGAHMGIRVIRTKYFRSKLFKDVKTFVKHCDLCQRMKMIAT